ncbi:MAG: trypsin-like serine peptidase [Geminicoccaceae bacterium]
MATATNDVEQLEGILSHFDEATVASVLARRSNGQANGVHYQDHHPLGYGTDAFGEEAITQAVSELRDMGDEVEPGHPGCATMQQAVAGEAGSDAAANANIERIVDRRNFLPAHFLTEGAEVQKAVARVKIGGGFGTGSLISNSLLLTNNHVIPSKQVANTAEAQFNFQLDESGAALAPDVYRCVPDSFFYTNRSLDFTIVRLRGRRLHQPTLPVTPPFTVDNQAVIGATGPAIINPPLQLPNLFITPGMRWGHLSLPTRPLTYVLNSFINIIQHPSARRKEVALQENVIDRVLTNAIRYTTDTEPGSSGSPVFDNKWDLVALHNAGGDRNNGVWINNNGIRADRIVADLRSQFAGQAVLNELGIA